jgi:hypothetical protein
MTRTRLILILAALVAATLARAGAAVEVSHVKDSWTLSADAVTVTLDAQAGTFTARSGGHTFLTDAVPGEGGEVTGVEATEVRDALGAGRMLLIARPSGRTDTLAVYDGRPWVVVGFIRRNATDQPLALSTLPALRAAVDAGVGALRAVGPDGVYDLADRDNYAYAAVADPATRAGVVCGWLTHRRASGVVSVRGKAGAAGLEARSEYGRVVVGPGETLEGERLAIGWTGDVLEGLRDYALASARAMDVRLPAKVPSGYCTWYHARALDEKRMAELAAWCKANLDGYGLDFLQIDDGWQIAGRDFTTHKPTGPYPGGMKATADAVTKAGMTAGIWFIPFGWDPKRPDFADHQDWFVHRADGSLYEVKWAGTCLDMTHPEAREFLRGVVERAVREWGYKYIKIDGLWTGLAAAIRYPDPAYGPDGLGDAVFRDAARPNLEVYRSGLALVREAAGPGVFVLGCNIAQNMRTMGGSIGLVDGMRIGPDVGAHWRGVLHCAKPATNLWFWHGAAWFNDPDCLMLRPPLTLDQARAWGSMIALSGQMVVVSEWLPDLVPERLDVLKRTIPNHGGCGRPVDLLDGRLACVWQLRADLAGARRDLVGLFNWDEKDPAEKSVDLAALGLPDGPNDEYIGFDYWENAFVGPVTRRLAAALRPSSCRVISLVRRADHPQLVGTSRHITQGAVDVIEAAWDAAPRTLAGRSRLVGGDACELRIMAGTADAARRAAAAAVSDTDRAAGVTATLAQDGPHVRVTLVSPAHREVAWRVTFE